MPKWARDIIYDRSEMEHCGDYGACIAQFIREAMEFQCFKEKFFNNDFDMKLIVNDKQEKEDTEGVLKFANGREVNK